MKLSHLPSFRRAAVASALLVAFPFLLSACAMRLEQPVSGYTCCNLRYDYGWVSSSNVLGGPILPAGESATLDTIKRDKYFYGTIGATYVSMYDDTARSKEDGLRWARQIVVPADPRLQLATWSPEVQSAVYAAKVVVGMSRPQVLMSLSYPSRNDTKDLNANSWRYWTAQDDEPVDVNFGADGKVSGFSGPPSAVRAVELKR
ncbi:hypothetical protein WKW80_30365 [Variovorax humicola]|uniref:DUF1566 domain-containing protein n=1 Tax=Variovorax humicola TaxID=1769758 RepID=A0ABU8W9Q2_9BURK